MTALTAIRTHLADHRARRAARRAVTAEIRERMADCHDLPPDDDDLGGKLRAVVADRPVVRGAK